MATNISGIPVVDFSAMSLQNESSVREDSDAVNQLADHVHQAFSTIGFVYLKNHGIPQEKVACKHVYNLQITVLSYLCLTKPNR